ncbi:hypothetical protein Tco_0008445 [Tanacetum coccineum]
MIENLLGVVGLMVGFKAVKQVYRLVSYRNNASTSGKKKQVAVSSKEVSSSNPFDAFNSVEIEDDLGTNEGIQSCSTWTAPIVERIDKLERQINEEKLTLVDDVGKPLPKVVSMKNADSDREVEDVIDDHAVFMASTSLKRGTNSGYDTNSLLEQCRTTKRDDDYDPYNDDLYESDRDRYMQDYESYEQFVALSEQEAEGSRSGSKRRRTYIPRELEEAKQRLIKDYFGDDEFLPKYPEENFRRRYRMSFTLFNKIVNDILSYDVQPLPEYFNFFRKRYDCTGRLSIGPILKCKSAIRQLVYGSAHDAFDMYLQIAEIIHDDV